MQIINNIRGVSENIPVMGFGCGFDEITGRVKIQTQTRYLNQMGIGSIWVNGL